MPRSKIGNKRPPVDVKAVELAVNDVIKNNIPVRTAAKTYGISHTTLDRHVQRFRASAEDSFTYAAKNDVKKVFNYDQEKELADYLELASIMHYGLTRKQAMTLAYQYASENHLDMPESWEQNECAGKEWLRGFRKRFPKLSLRQPEATSLARASGFNKENVKAFFKNLKTVMERDTFPPGRIYNVDETGNSSVHTPPKIISTKGIKQVGSVTSGERGINVTMIAAVNAIGNQVPPMLIFPRVHFKLPMLRGAPPGSIGGANPSGWSTEDLFFEYLQHFAREVRPTKENKVLLIMDTHISIASINFARDNGIVFLTLPPHTSHKLQPLDRTVFGPFKGFYNTAVHEWMTTHGGTPLTMWDIAKIVGKAYPKAFTTQNIVNGFQCTGIFPLNKHIFGDHEFLPSYSTDRPLPAEDEVAGPSGTAAPASEEAAHTSPTNISSPGQVWKTPEMIRPFPKAGPRKRKGGRKPGRTRILTDTPEKDEIERQAASKKRQGSNRANNPKKRGRPAVVKQILAETSSSSDESFSLDDSSDISLSEIMFDDRQEQALMSEEISVGDCLIVKVSGKKSVENYVAEVVNIIGLNELEVNYYKRITGTTKFHKECEVYNISKDDIVRCLPPPNPAGSSERLRELVCFPVDFGAYNVK